LNAIFCTRKGCLLTPVIDVIVKAHVLRGVEIAGIPVKLRMTILGVKNLN
jgi:hypothetical protein